MNYGKALLVASAFAIGIGAHTHYGFADDQNPPANSKQDEQPSQDGKPANQGQGDDQKQSDDKQKQSEGYDATKITEELIKEAEKEWEQANNIDTEKGSLTEVESQVVTQFCFHATRAVAFWSAGMWLQNAPNEPKKVDTSKFRMRKTHRNDGPANLEEANRQIKDHICP